MKWLISALVVCLLLLQYRLWIGDGSIAEVVQLQREIQAQEDEIERLRERNRILALEVQELKTGVSLIEERARSEMGMVKEGETFYMIVDGDETEKPAGQSAGQ
ncbi:cell division protein FtsB [Gilvimarinus sp. F26214L]|uniref:cell division protein FtsB n=1 Tax=Gilvimarinus sp. DZF01 TaxID=3461371 RepID=UPI004045271D